MSADMTEKTQIIDTIKDQISARIPDLDEASKGDMNLYSPSKNIRIQVANKQKIIKSDFTKFDSLVDKLQPAVAVFVSHNDDIPMRIKAVIVNGKPVVEFFINSSDITDRFVEMLSSYEDIPALEEKSLALENSKKKPKESLIEQYEATPEEFTRYCNTIAVSKVEYEKAKNKWPDEMKQFENRTKFIEHIKHGRSAPAPATSNGSKEEFHEFVRSSPLSKITKKEIKTRFGNLPDEVTFMNKTGESFKTEIKKLKESLHK